MNSMSYGFANLPNLSAQASSNSVFVVFFFRLAFHPRRDAEADFFGVAFGVEGEEAGEDFVAEVGGPEQAALVGVVVLVGLVEEDRLGACGEVVPAVGFEHGAVHGGVQLAQALDVLGGLARDRGSDCRSWSCPRCGRP